MSAGGLFGYVFNIIAYGAIWWVLGALVDRLGMAFNSTINVLPTFQDAVTGFTTIQVIWGSLLAIMYIFLSINYFITTNSQQTQEV